MENKKAAPLTPERNRLELQGNNTQFSHNLQGLCDCVTIASMTGVVILTILKFWEVAK